MYVTISAIFHDRDQITRGRDKQIGMSGNTRIPTIDSDELTSDAVRSVMKLVRSKLPDGANFMTFAETASSIMADLMWHIEEECIKSQVTHEPRVIVDGVAYKRLSQPSSAVYFGMWGGHHVEEPLYRMEGIRNGPTVKPIELALGVAEGRFLPTLASAAGGLMAHMTDREAEKTLTSLGFRPCSRSTLAKGVGAMLEDVAANVAEIEAEARSTESLGFEVGMVSCGLDRFAVRMDEVLQDELRRNAKLRAREKNDYVRTPPEPYERSWRMAWAANLTIYDLAGEPRKTVWYAANADSDPIAVADRVIDDVLHILGKHPRAKIASVVDGASDVAVLQHRMRERLAAVSSVEYIIDFYHAAQYVQRVAAAEESSHDVANDEKSYAHRLRHEHRGAQKLLDDFKLRLADGTISEELRNALAAAIRYIEPRSEMMQYARLSAEGYVLGSGATESACALQQLRVKRPGSHWSPDGLAGVLAARALWLSGRWQAAMAFQLRKNMHES